MAADFVDDGGAGWGGTGFAFGEFSQLSKAARRKAVARKRAQQERWQRAQRVRAKWTPSQHEEEARRIAAEVAEWERQRDAA